MEARCELWGEGAQSIGVVGRVRLCLQPDSDFVELHDLRPFLDLSRSGLRRVGKVETVEAAEDPVALAQGARARLRDARLTEVVTHQLERVGRRRYSPDDEGERGHEVH